MSTDMSDYKIVSRYARSILELSEEREQLDRTIENAKFLSEVIRNRPFLNFLNNPVIKSEKKIRVFRELFKTDLDSIFYKFVELVTRKGRENLLPKITKEIIVQYKVMKHISDIHLTTAEKLDNKFLDKLNELLLKSPITDEKVNLITNENKKIIGGFILQVDDKLLDMSVRAKLKKIESEIIEEEFVKKI